MSARIPILLLGTVLVGCGGDGGETSAVRKPVPEIIRHGKIVSDNPAAIEAGLKAIDLAQAWLAGSLTVESNDPALDIGRLFDKNEESLAKSAAINPLILTFTFHDPIRLKSVRIYPSYSTYDWAVRASQSSEGFVIKSTPPKAWSRLDLPQAEETRQIRMEVLRLISDDYVHLNEVEFHQE